MGSLPLLRGIFPTQELISGLPHSKWFLYQLSHQGSPITSLDLMNDVDSQAVVRRSREGGGAVGGKAQDTQVCAPGGLCLLRIQA